MGKQETTISTAGSLNNGKTVMTIQEWFDNRLARYESRGKSHTDALDETYEDLDIAERFSNDEKDAFYKEHKGGNNRRNCRVCSSNERSRHQG